MKKNTLLLAMSILFTANCFAQLPNYLWATSPTGPSLNVAAASVATDNNGNVIVTGYFRDTLTFGTFTLTNAGPSNTEDIFIAKYDPNGNVLWARQQTAGGSGTDFTTSIAADDSGNIIVTGNFTSTSITFGTTTLTRVGGGIDIFIVKFDSNGNVLWAKQQTAAGTSSDYAKCVAADDSGNVIITGSIGQGSITFGTTTITNGSNFAPGIFIVKYDGNGNVLWANDAWGNSYGNSVTTDASGNVYVTGSFMTPDIIFGSILLSNTNWPSNDIFIVKYNANGIALWAKKQNAGGAGEDHANSVAVDASGNVIVTGTFLSTSITFGTTTLTNAGSSSSDIFIVKYGPNGNVLWARQQDAGGSLGDGVNSVAADDNGNVYVAGSFNSPSIAFGIATLTNAGSSSGDIFIVKYDPNGIVLWAKKQDAGGSLGDGANSVAADDNGNVYVAGGFNSPSITFGATSLTNAGGYDMFIVKLGTVTGIANTTFNNEVRVYPNPTTGLLFLSNNYNVTLTDLTGKIITKEQNTNAIDISNQPAGIYFLLLTDKKGQIVQRSKVMKE